DCSGSVSYALAAAGLVSAPMVSGDFETWGEPGPGRWITVYANAGHVWMEVAGWRFDTVAQAVTGTRWAQGGGEFSGFVVRHPTGL
ncbi:MAG: peptidoglycan endopeptidase, partial [Solirubrobacteraceae bacterium]